MTENSSPPILKTGLCWNTLHITRLAALRYISPFYVTVEVVDELKIVTIEHAHGKFERSVAHIYAVLQIVGEIRKRALVFDVSKSVYENLLIQAAYMLLHMA